MRSIDVWRRLDDRRQWLQLGLVSAGVIAPLIARWNELRGAERVNDVLGEVEARLKSVGTHAPGAYRDMRQQLAEVARQTGGRIMNAGSARTSNRRLSRGSWLWLAGAGLGLAAAGAGTFVLVRRRLRAEIEEPLFDLPIPSINGASANGGARTPTPTRPLSEQPRDDLLEDDVIVAATPWDGGGATVTPTGAPAGVVDPAAAPFIGDIKSMIYHESNAETLPAEQNRVYFASEEEAREAGYHRDRDEVPRV